MCDVISCKALVLQPQCAGNFSVEQVTMAVCAESIGYLRALIQEHIATYSVLHLYAQAICQ